jgi:hypothetical protein
MSTKLVHLFAKDPSNRLRKYEVELFEDADRIYFVKSPFDLKDEIKAMKGSKWEPDAKLWSIENCQRNHFQLRYLRGEKPYAWFDRPVIEHDFTRPLMPHQCDLANRGLTYHYQLWAAEMGTGKTLAAQEVIERSGHRWWFWVGPKTSIPNIKRELEKWKLDPSIQIEFFTYEGLKQWVDNLQPGDPIPPGVIFDESSKLKAWTTKRSKDAQKLADLIRERHGEKGFVILMSGTPSPKSPKDWWSQCEICWPGYLREGSDKALENRLAFMVKKTFEQGPVNVRESWRDDEAKCNQCGQPEWHDDHDSNLRTIDYHPWTPSKNEVAFMFERLKGLVVVKHKKDCLTLPEKRYREIICKPAGNILRVAKMIAEGSENAVTAMTLLRELSDGFQYRKVKDGKMPCNHCEDGTVTEWFDPLHDDRTYQSIDILDPEVVARLKKHSVDCPQCHGTREMDRFVRETKLLPCPKEGALRELLAENEETGRIVIFAGFTGSVDRCIQICQEEKWDVFRCDGRGSAIINCDGEVVQCEPLEYWSKHQGRVAFVAHPESGGMSLTLVEARMAVYWSNSFKPEYRIQSEDRIHRIGADMNLGCEIVDLIHLPSDRRVLEIIRDNRRLELMTMSELKELLGEEFKVED